MKDTLLDIEKTKCSQRVVDALNELQKAVNRYRPEFVTPELLLYAICTQKEFMQSCDTSGINLEEFQNELGDYLDSQDRIPAGEEYTPLLSTMLIDLLDELAEYHEEALTENSDSIIRVSDLFDLLGAQDGTMASYLIDKYFNDAFDFFLDKIEQNYHEVRYVEEEEETNIQKAYEDEEGGDEDACDSDMVPQVIARAYVNGKKIDIEGLSQEEILQKMMSSAQHLMGALNSIGGQSKETGNNKRRTPHRREPWEDLVVCLNQTYKQKNPLIGREKELTRCIRILCRKDKNNPLFIGEPGVGKTALIYGLTQMIEEGRVPEWLKGHTVYSLDLATLLAGSSYHGEFEKRMKMVLEGARKRGKCIIYIDEIHNLCDTGGGNQSMNAGEILKPYLEDGSLRFIGTTTYQDYNKSIANKKAIARRFGQIDVKEPSIDETVQILQGLLPYYEKHHGVKYAQDAVRYAVEQSDALIHDRFLPDKAIDIIDEAGAYLQQNPKLDKNGAPKQSRYQKIDTTIIKQILTDVCRIDAKALTSQNNNELKDLDKRISHEIYGQDQAIKQVVRAVMMSKAGLMEPNKPIASLLFVGPTGVGKTEVCKVLAKELGIELVRFDMSEYTEKHTISKLIGSPAGYVGYDEGGLLTDAIRKTPNCVLLLDEIEKAHADIYNILLQVMDYAKLTDNKGNKADFRNVILVMTSNAGAQFAAQAGIGFVNGQSKGQAMLSSVKKTFKPEFLNRLSGTVVFNDMDKNMAILILDKKLRELKQRLEARNVTMKLTMEAHNFLLEKGYNPQYGAREMDRTLQHYLIPMLMEQILFGKLKKGGEITIGLEELNNNKE